MPLAIRLHATGGPEQLRAESIELAPPGPGEVRVRLRAVGLNFIDVYHRVGLYPVSLPFIPGQEGAGEVTALGPGVTSLAPGDRVAWGGLGGSYTEERNAPADRLVKLPAFLSFEQGAAVMLKGMTAELLVRRCRPLAAGETVLVHAAAGGVGQLLCQWAKAAGARTIGAVGSREKVAHVKGCDEVLVVGADLAARVKALTGGRGVSVVYDSVGKDTLAASLEVLAPRGMLVAFGQSSGRPPPIELATLAARSLYVTRPSLFAYVATRAELEASAAALFDVLERGVVKVSPPTCHPLADAAKAHRALEGRATTGSVVLTVGERAAQP